MPRTKRRTVKRASADMNMTANMTCGNMINQPKNIKEILEEFDSEKRCIEDHFSEVYDNYRNMVENSFLMVEMNLAGSMNTKLYDYILECNLVKSNIATSTSHGTERSARTTTKTTVTKNMRQRNASAVTTSKTNSSATVTKHRSATRSEDRAPLAEKNDSSKYKTPVNRPPLPASVTVTPKVNVNEPMSMMRRPNQGEVALSMTGSPLMISSVSRDDMATVSVPLANGNILSILPRAGATMDISFDEQTKNELLLLKGNIEGLLKMNSCL